MQDSKTESLTDALSKHIWDSCVTQWAFNNLFITIFIMTTSNDLRLLEPVTLNLVAAIMQLFAVIFLFAFSLIP